MAITISSGYSIYNQRIRSGNPGSSGIRKVFVGTNKVGIGGEYSNTAVAGYIRDSSGTTKDIIRIYRGTTCLWERGYPSSLVEYAEVYYKFYQNGKVVDFGEYADSVEKYKQSVIGQSTIPTAIGVYIKPLMSRVSIEVYKNNTKLTPSLSGSSGTNAKYYDNNNIVDASVSPGINNTTESQIFGAKDDYVFKFKSGTTVTNSGSSSTTSNVTYTFKILYTPTNQSSRVIATVTVDLTGHDYNGYT